MKSTLELVKEFKSLTIQETAIAARKMEIIKALRNDNSHTLQEIAVMLGLKSRSTIFHHLNKMK